MHPVLPGTCPTDVILIRWLHLGKEEWYISPTAGHISSEIKNNIYVLNLSKGKVNRIWAELKSPKSIVKNPTCTLIYCTIKIAGFFSLIYILSKPWVGIEGYCHTIGRVEVCDFPWL